MKTIYEISKVFNKTKTRFKINEPIGIVHFGENFEFAINLKSITDIEEN